MQNLTIYRIFTYLLLAVGVVMAFLFVTLIMATLVNPVLLLPLFVLACVLIYTYSSWRFLTKGIDAHQYCKPSLRDLIRVNGYGASFFASLTVIQCLTLIMKPELLENVMEQALALQKTSVTGMEDMMHKMMHYMLRFMLVYGIILILHIFMTFRLLRQHADAFDS